MYAQDARKWLSDQLIRESIAPAGRPVFDAQGQAAFSSKEGVHCLFCIPDQDPRWYLFSHLREIEPSRDGSCLALALALNLQPQIMQGTSIGLSLESRQLMLHQIIDVEPAFLNVKVVINHFVESSIRIGEELLKLHQEKTSMPMNQFGRDRLASQSLTPGFTTQSRKNVL